MRKYVVQLNLTQIDSGSGNVVGNVGENRYREDSTAVLLLHERVGSGGGNPTLVVLISTHINVSLITPLRSPGVLHNIELHTIGITTEPNGQDTMIQLIRTAFRLIIDSLMVELEAPLASINGYRDWSLLPQGEGKSGFISRRYIDEASVGSSLVPRVVLTLSILGSVWIALLSIDTVVLLDVLKSIVHHSPIAPVVAILGGTINKVLLGQRYEILCLQGKGSFEGASS